MRKLLTCLIAVLAPLSTLADQHGSAEMEVRAAVASFNGAYLKNDVDKYFGHYVEDATLFFLGARQSVAAYHEEWQAMIAGGGGVEENDLEDVRVQVLPGGEAAVATYFIDYAIRSAEGTSESGRAFETDVWQKIGGAWKVVSLHFTELGTEGGGD